jgi:hypothetical protein
MQRILIPVLIAAWGWHSPVVTWHPSRTEYADLARRAPAVSGGQGGRSSSGTNGRITSNPAPGIPYNPLYGSSRPPALPVS